MTNQSEDISRREVLSRMALLSAGVEYFASMFRTTDRSEKWAPEDALVHYAAAITPCEHLSKGGGEGISLAYGVLTTYLDPLKKIVNEYSQHRVEAALLVAQALLVKATLSLHREGPKRAINYGKQACIYSKVSENVPLRLATLKRLAWMYACNKQEPQALDTMLKAQSLLQKQLKKVFLLILLYLEKSMEECQNTRHKWDKRMRLFMLFKMPKQAFLAQICWRRQMPLVPILTNRHLS
jgi:hypothetical protein